MIANSSVAKSRIRARIAPWIALQELPKHLANLLPFFLGTAIVWWAAGAIDWTVLVVSLAALFFLTDGTYIANEYFDLECDRANVTRIGGDRRVGVTTTGGTRVLVQGLIQPRQALLAAIVSFLIAVPLGAWLQFGLGTGPVTIPLGLLGIFIGWFYSAPPIRASYRGFGEIFIAIGQGIVVFGAYYVQLGFGLVPIIASLPWIVALPALKIIRQFPDYAADAAAGKRGLVHRLGRERAARLYGTLIVLAIGLFVPQLAIVQTPALVLALAPIVPLARSARAMLRGHWRDPARLEAAAVNGFIGMLLIPLALGVIFLLSAGSGSR